jgi:hypothetical protein
MGLRNLWNTLSGQNFFSGYGSVDWERGRDAASKCPYAQFLDKNVMDGLVIKIQLTTDHSAKRRSEFTAVS